MLIVFLKSRVFNFLLKVSTILQPRSSSVNSSFHRRGTFMIMMHNYWPMCGYTMSAVLDTSLFDIVCVSDKPTIMKTLHYNFMGYRDQTRR